LTRRQPINVPSLVSNPRVLFSWERYQCQCGRRFSTEPLPSIIGTLVGGVGCIASSSASHGRQYGEAAAMLGVVGLALFAFGVWQGWTRKRFPEAN
jgi:hypothetical protein